MVELLILLLTFLELGCQLVELSVDFGDDSGAISQNLLKMRVLKSERADFVLEMDQTIALRERIELLSDEMDGLIIDLRLQLADALVQSRDFFSLVLVFFGEFLVVGLEGVKSVLKPVEIFKTHLLKQIISQRMRCCSYTVMKTSQLIKIYCQKKRFDLTLRSLNALFGKHIKYFKLVGIIQQRQTNIRFVFCSMIADRTDSHDLYQQIKLMADTIVEPQKLQSHNQPQVKMTNSEPAKQATLEPITNQGATSHHKKRKRKHHKKAKIVRDPEEIKELRLQRLNVKREVHWDNRFVLQTIPDLFVQKTKKREIVSRARYPLHSAYVEKERPKLPELKQRMLETAARNNHKSFKIRPTKNSEGVVKPKEQAIEKLKEEAGQNEEQKESKKISKKERTKEKLLLKLQQKVKLIPTNPIYRDLLADVIERSTQKKHKPIRTIIEKQIDSIGANDNIYSRLEKLAMDRRKMLLDIKESGATAILKVYLDFQIHSLLLVEQILKFKAFWQALYVENLKHQRKVHFFLENKNYLLEMKKEVEEIAANDPFLVEKTNSLQKLINNESKEEELQERKEMMLKIRACELLLIEEQLLADL